jgi:hypothetical protein
MMLDHLTPLPAHLATQGGNRMVVGGKNVESVQASTTKPHAYRYTVDKAEFEQIANGEVCCWLRAATDGIRPPAPGTELLLRTGRREAVGTVVCLGTLTFECVWQVQEETDEGTRVTRRGIPNYHIDGRTIGDSLAPDYGDALAAMLGRGLGRDLCHLLYCMTGGGRFIGDLVYWLPESLVRIEAQS